MSQRVRKDSKTFEFLSLFTMVVGTVIGAGIYFKNSEVLKATGNPIIGLILWAIVGIVCLLSVLVFMEISSSTKNQGNGTIGNWTKLFINRKTASFFALLYIIVLAPAAYSMFTGLFVYYFLKLINVKLSASSQLLVYLFVGIFLIYSFALLNGLKPKWAKGIQIFGTIFKFIPLFIALIAGFFLIDKTTGAAGTSAMWNGEIGSKEHNWSTSNWSPVNFFRGFGGILFAFDGYIYIANSQKTVKHKEVVPKALMFGMIFVTIFYLLMAVSLFLGSPDGSIVSLFEKLFKNEIAANVISNLIMVIICLLSLNLFIMVGTINVESDTDAKLLYVGTRRGKVSKFKSALVVVSVATFFYVVFILMGFLIPRGDFKGWNDEGFTNHEISNHVLDFANIISSVAAIVSFFLVVVLIFAVLVNRKTKKVVVDQYKGMPPLAIISGIGIILFIVAGLYTFIIPDPTHEQKWSTTTAPYFLVLFGSMLLIAFFIFLIQEALFKKYPFKDGFEGQLLDEDPRPLIFKINPIKNYYTSKGIEESEEYHRKKRKQKKINKESS